MADFRTRMREWGTNAWRAAAIAAAATALIFAASHSTPFAYLNFWTYDFTVNHAGLSAPSRDVIFVDFDDDTFHRIGKYPVPRDAVATVIKAVAAQKPRVPQGEALPHLHAVKIVCAKPVVRAHKKPLAPLGAKP